MSAIDHSDIDGRLLQLLLAVTEERSVTRAAARLDVTQSAVSYQLDRLRRHQRHQADAMHRWLREELLAIGCLMSPPEHRRARIAEHAARSAA